MFGCSPTGKVTSPLEKGDHPELDTSELLDQEGIERYQSLISMVMNRQSRCPEYPTNGSGAFGGGGDFVAALPSFDFAWCMALRMTATGTDAGPIKLLSCGAKRAAVVAVSSFDGRPSFSCRPIRSTWSELTGSDCAIDIAVLLCALAMIASLAMSGGASATADNALRKNVWSKSSTKFDTLSAGRNVRNCLLLSV
jgi:hypothetical protein